MKIVYTATAVEDIDAIADYLEPRHARAAESVAMSKLIEPTNSYLIYYRFRAEDGVVYILAIQHPARERPFSDD